MFPVCVDSNSYNHRHLLFLRIAPRYKCRHSHQTLSKLSARAPRFPCPRLPPIRRNFLTRRGLLPILGAPRADGLRERCAAVAWVQNAVANKLDPTLVLAAGRALTSDLMRAGAQAAPLSFRLLLRLSLHRHALIWTKVPGAWLRHTALVAPFGVVSESLCGRTGYPWIFLQAHRHLGKKNRGAGAQAATSTRLPGQAPLDDARRPPPRPRAGPGGLHFCRRRSAALRAVANQHGPPREGRGAARLRFRPLPPSRCLFVPGLGPVGCTSAAAAPLHCGRSPTSTARPGRGAAQLDSASDAVAE